MMRLIKWKSYDITMLILYMYIYLADLINP